MTETRACPECDSAKVQRRMPEHPHSAAGGRWYCNGCNEHIDEPTTREEKQPGGRYGLSKALAEADKEAWP